jgi:hypothetical protein
MAGSCGSSQLITVPHCRNCSPAAPTAVALLYLMQCQLRGGCTQTAAGPSYHLLLLQLHSHPACPLSPSRPAAAAAAASCWRAWCYWLRVGSCTGGWAGQAVHAHNCCCCCCCWPLSCLLRQQCCCDRSHKQVLAAPTPALPVHPALLLGGQLSCCCCPGPAAASGPHL